ncbi:hypothetical protein ACQEVG_37195 [Streptomyces sp. CA-135486]|uniref:hypothetical protein n=1 Tax=Streptomyces sp. CA-135486 TaxID=3240049 RepID=UPI003D938CFC
MSLIPILINSCRASSRSSAAAPPSTANANRYLASTETIEQIAGDVSTVWSDLLTSATGFRAEQTLRL